MTDSTTRAKTGIGAVIIFVSIVLVAAIAGGIMMAAAGLLQTEADETAAETSDQVVDRVEIQSITGRISEDNTVRTIHFTVSRGPGSGDIDLENTTYELVDAKGTVRDRVGGNDSEIRVITAKNDGFVISEKSDKFILSVPVGQADRALRPGESFRITFTTVSGASTNARARVPPSLTGRSEVKIK